MKIKINQVFIVICFLASSLFSCLREGDELGEWPKTESEIISTSNELQIVTSNWKEQLFFVKSGDLSNALLVQGLKLVRYSTQEEKNSSIKSSGLSLDTETFFPIYQDTIFGQNSFVITSSKSLKAEAIDFHAQRKQEIINASKEANFDIVKLEWDYKGMRFFTSALVSIKSKSIIYDDVLSNITFDFVSSTESSDETSLELKSGGSETGGQDGPVEYVFRTPTLTKLNWANFIVAEAYCTITVNGNRSGGVVSITGESHLGYRHASAGYGADADVRVTSIVTGSGGHCSYSYGALVANSTSYSLSWSGVSFVIPSGSGVMGLNGGSTIGPSNLN